MRRIFILILAFLSASSFFIPLPAFAGSQAVAYLCDIGTAYYRSGNYEEALSEFNKVLLLDPSNKTAQDYVNKIFQSEDFKYSEQLPKQAPEPVVLAYKIPTLPPEQTLTYAPIKPSLTRDQAIDNALERFSSAMPASAQPLLRSEEKKKDSDDEGIRFGNMRLSGQLEARMGVTSSDVIWKQANWDLNEKNWRMLSNKAYDNRENTYDKRIYDRLNVNLDMDETNGFSFHSNITVDPWSFVGKSDKITIAGAGWDAAEIQLKYWSNTGYTLNERVFTLFNGDSLNLPEIKVSDNSSTTPITVLSAFGNTYSIPKLKIHREFQPLREIWMDYKTDVVKLKVFPYAYESQAVTFDDPLRLSNNRIWWEDSPWIHSWQHGKFNAAAAPIPGVVGDFTRGNWNDEISFFARDSEGQRLTSLRGATFEYTPFEKTSLISSLATPKNQWQDYSEVDNVIFANRLKHFFLDNLRVGAIYTSRYGFNIDQSYESDARNYVAGGDISWEFMDGLQANVEVASSRSFYDISNSQYKSDIAGNAYHVSLVGRFPRESIINSEYGYDSIQPMKGEKYFNKFRLFASRMDSEFDQPLSNFRETRDDEFWGRHIHFRQPFKYYYQGEGAMLTWDDVKNFKIGNGIDVGRSVIGLRVESSLWDDKLNNLFDVRNVHDSDNSKFIENVVRDELTWSVTDRFTTKALGIYQKLPHTLGGTDPFIFNPQSNRYYDNTYIQDGVDPSINTGSLGMEYKFFDWLSLNGIWEYTNDISLGYDSFDRGILNDGNRSAISQLDGNYYRDIRNWLYSQAMFPNAPYPYYNIFKSGLTLAPLDNLNIYLDYTRNSYEKAGQVDDNMNHIGLQVAYSPMPKLAVFLKYTYSRWQDLDKLLGGSTKLYSHHNFFAEFIYRMTKDQDFTFQYGEASRDPYMGDVLDIGWDPYGGSLRTIDTQHILRMYYRKKF